MKKALSGWIRLWILFSGIYLILVIGFVIVTFPKPETISHSQVFYDQIAPELKNKILGKEDSENYRSKKWDYLKEAKKRGLITEVEMPNGHSMFFLNDLPKEEMLLITKAYWKVVEKTANKRQFHYIGQAFLYWLLPVLVIYGLGLSVGWVYKGFKR